MKKQSIGKRVPCHWDSDEIAVAEILTQLVLNLIPSYDSPNPSLAWGAKRRRSQPKPPSSSAAIETKINVMVVAATSPATPLMFSPSESDDNNKSNTPNSHVSVSKKKLQNKEELMQSFTELTHQKDSLVKEMEAVKRHHDGLRTSNLELKHRKQVIIHALSPSGHQTLHQQQQQQLLHYPFQLQHPTMQCSAPSVPPAFNKISSVGLPDLNLTLEEVAAAAGSREGEGGGYRNVMMVMDDNVNNSRALASAQARKRRMQIYKEKNQNQILRQR